MSNPTARERAERIEGLHAAIGRIVGETMNRDGAAVADALLDVEVAVGEYVLAAERAAVEAFLAYLGCHGDDSYSRWMRERFIEWSLREREGAK